MKDRVVFLDFDGVVNTPIWRDYWEDGAKVFKCKYAWPYDGFVNNYQAICWLNELYNKYPYDIVVTSSWRTHTKDYTPEECLYNGGLSKDINIIGYTDYGDDRSALVNDWIVEHDFKGDYVIFDDVDYFTYDSWYYIPTNPQELSKHFIHTDENVGITYPDFVRACNIFYHHEKQDELDEIFGGHDTED